MMISVHQSTSHEPVQALRDLEFDEAGVLEVELL